MECLSVVAVTHFALLLLPIAKLPSICYTMSDKSSYFVNARTAVNSLVFFKSSCTDSVQENNNQGIISMAPSEGNFSHKNWTKFLQHYPECRENLNRIEETLIEQSGWFS